MQSKTLQGSAQPLIPVDIETTGLSFMKDRILGVGYGTEYLPPSTQYPGALTAQNMKFEYRFFKKAGVKADIQFDTMLAASLLIDRPESLDLASLAEHYLGWESWKGATDKLFKKKNWVQLLEADPEMQKALKERNIYDLKATAALTEVLLKKLEEEGMSDFYFKRLHPAAKMMAECEYRGMGIDIGATQMHLAELVIKIADLETTLKDWLGQINLNSPVQLKKALKGKGYNLFIYDFKKKQTVESTGVDALERLLPNPQIEKLLEYRGAQKLKGYLEGWLEEHVDGRLYGSFNLASTRTGRLSSSNPNLQQVPRNKEIRSLFVPTKGKVFVIADYGQIEPRVAVHYSGEESLKALFEAEQDFYGDIAVKVLGVQCTPNEVKKLYPKERFLAKQIGLSILYGIGADKLSTMIKKGCGQEISAADCKIIIRNYFKAYPQFLKFREYVIGKIEKREILKTVYGRQFKIEPRKAFSTGINTIIQSTASDACLFSQLSIEKRLKDEGLEAELIALVHDECIFETAPENAERVGKIIEEVLISQPFNCPLKVDWAIGDSWGSKS